MRLNRGPSAVALPAAASVTAPVRLLLVLLALAASSAGEPQRGTRVLALIGSDELRDTHAGFFRGLEEAGLTVDVRGYKDAGLALRRFDEMVYDHLVLFAPKATSFGGGITRAAVAEFVDAGGNALLALAPGASDAVRSIAADCGVEPDAARGAQVFDHFSCQAVGGTPDASLVASGAWVDEDAILGAARPRAPVMFRGVGLSVRARSELVTVALSAEPTAYTKDPQRSDPPAASPAGSSIALVALLQARNNARVLVAGSLEMFGADAFGAPIMLAGSGKRRAGGYPQSGNRDFVLAAALWTFQRRGVLVAGPPLHRNAATGEEGPLLFRVKDESEFEIDIRELESGEARPYRAEDVQLSWVMLDPHIRQPLVPSGDGKFTLKFTVPDVYGVFKYVIDYRRAGYSYINLQKARRGGGALVVPVRPFRHDEYERFLPPAYPYYASALSTMAAVFLLGFVYLYGKW